MWRHTVEQGKAVRPSGPESAEWPDEPDKPSQKGGFSLGQWAHPLPGSTVIPSRIARRGTR